MPAAAAPARSAARVPTVPLAAAPPRLPRVAYVISGLGAGGAERQLTALVRRLRERGYPVLVVSILGGGMHAAPLRAAGAEVLELGPSNGKRPGPRALWRGVRRLREWRPDVVHGFMFHGALLARLAGLARRAPLRVSSVRTTGEHRGPRAWGYRLTDRLCDVVAHVDAGEAKAFVERRVTRRRVEVIANGVDLARAPAARGRSEREHPFRWVAIGRLEEAKDYPLLLDAFRRVLDGGADAELWIAGEGSLRGELEARAARLELGGRLRLLGHHDDVASLFAQADGYVLSSNREGMPNALLEAGWAGLPVVATRVGAVGDIVEAGKNGVLVPPRDPEALADAMGAMMRLPAGERRRMGEAGRECVRARYSLDAAVEAWCRLYAGALEPSAIRVATKVHPADERVEVVRIIARLNVGGPALHTMHLSNGLRGDYPTLLVAGDVDQGEADLTHEVEARGVKVLRLPELGRRLHPWQDLAALVKLVRLLRRLRPRIVHTHTAKAGTLGRIAAVLAGVPVRVHTFHGHVFHGYFGSLATRVFLVIERALARVTTRVVTISPAQADEISGTYRVCPRERIEIIPLGLDLEPFAPALTSHLAGELRRELGIGAEPVISIVGRLVPIKNHGLLLDAAARLAAAGVAFHLAVVGGGPELERLRARAAELGLEGRVSFLGWRRDLQRIYAGSDVVALTSANEGTPVCLIEALAAGRAVVSTDVGGVRDVLAGGELGVLVPPGDADAFAAALRRLLDDPGLRAELGRRGARAAPARYGVGRLLDDVRGLYDRLACEPSSAD